MDIFSFKFDMTFTLNDINLQMNLTFNSDLDFDSMTLILKLDLDMIRMYVCSKNEVLTFSGLKVIVWTDTQMGRQTQLKLLPIAYADGNYINIFLRYFRVTAKSLYLGWISDLSY